MWFANTHDGLLTGVFSNYLKRFYFKDTKGILNTGGKFVFVAEF